MNKNLGGACGVTYKNEFLLFGWKQVCYRDIKAKILEREHLHFEKNLNSNLIFKVLKVKGCKLEKTMSLDQNIPSLACGTYNFQTQEQVLVCFDWYHPKECHW